MDLLAPRGMLPKDPMGPSPLLLSAIMPTRKSPSSAPRESDVAVEIRDARAQLTRSHEGIQRLVEKDARADSHLVREIAAERALRATGS